jgi:hypothetical protein
MTEAAKKEDRTMKYFALAVVLGLMAVQVMAQSVPAPAWSPSKSIGVFVFPKNNQNADQQLKDESECYGAAKQQSGIDPQAPPPAGPTAEEQQAAQKAAADQAQQKKGGRAQGAARGAAGGAAIGAIAGDAGKGAAIGATAGTMKGGMAQRQSNAQATQQAAAKTAEQQKETAAEMKAAHAEGLDTFQRAFGACMDARGYSVK